MHRNVHASHMCRPVGREGKTRGTMAGGPPEQRESLHLEKGKPRWSFLLLIAGIKGDLGDVIIGLAENIYLADNSRKSLINQKQL